MYIYKYTNAPTALKQQRRNCGEAAPSSRSAQISISQHLLYLQSVCGARSNSAHSLKMHAAHTPTLGVRRVQLSHLASLQWQLIKVGRESLGFAAPHTSLRPAAGGSLHSQNDRSTGCSLDLKGLPRFDPQGFVSRVSVLVCVSVAGAADASAPCRWRWTAA